MYIHTCTCIRIQICIHICIGIGIGTGICMCMCIYIYIYIYICVYIYIYIYTYICLLPEGRCKRGRLSRAPPRAPAAESERWTETPVSEIVSNWRLACHINLSLGRCPVELAHGPTRVALVRGFAILEKSLDNSLEKFLI